MRRLASDAEFNGRTIKALRHKEHSLDLRRVQDVGLRTAMDADGLARPASEDRILVTHVRRTVPRYAFERVRGRGNRCLEF
jgi:hypothetical protein